MGTGQSPGASYFVADGINERGLEIAELYLPKEAIYQKEIEDGKINLEPFMDLYNSEILSYKLSVRT